MDELEFYFSSNHIDSSLDKTSDSMQSNMTPILPLSTPDNLGLNDFTLTSPALKPDMIFKKPAPRSMTEHKLPPPSLQDIPGYVRSSDLTMNEVDQFEQQLQSQLLHHQISSLVSPALTPQMMPMVMSPAMSPVTPAQLMQMTSDHFHSLMTSPSMSPTNMSISFVDQPTSKTPVLKPILPNTTPDKSIASQLASKSNYENIVQGNTDQLGILYSPDMRSSVHTKKSSHKFAEQKRRDSMKHQFDELRRLLPMKGDRNMPKITVLQRAQDYIVELLESQRQKDEEVARLRRLLDKI